MSTPWALGYLHIVRRLVVLFSADYVENSGFNLRTFVKVSDLFVFNQLVMWGSPSCRAKALAYAGSHFKSFKINEL